MTPQSRFPTAIIVGKRHCAVSKAMGNINSDTTGFDLSPQAITYTATDIAILASVVNFLLPNRGFGVGWGGVKKLRLLQGLL